MFGLEKRKIIHDTLRFTYRDHPRSRWWLCDDSLIGISRVIKETVCNPGGDPVTDNVDIIRRAPRKVVYRIRDADGGGSYICKAFFLDHLSHRLRYFAYGLDEAANYILAGRKGIDTATVYGYGQICDATGLVHTSIVIIEDLQGFCWIGDLLDDASETERIQLLRMTVGLFTSLYRANCNHIDIGCDAVLLDKDRGSSNVYLIDFQHARFRKAPSYEVLMFETGFFARSCSRWLPKTAIYEWLKEILDAVGVEDAGRRATLTERFDYYFLSKGLSPTQSTLSRRQRKAIR